MPRSIISRTRVPDSMTKSSGVRTATKIYRAPSGSVPNLACASSGPYWLPTPAWSPPTISCVAHNGWDIADLQTANRHVYDDAAVQQALPCQVQDRGRPEQAVDGARARRDRHRAGNVRAAGSRREISSSRQDRAGGRRRFPCQRRQSLGRGKQARALHRP